MSHSKGDILRRFFFFFKVAYPEFYNILLQPLNITFSYANQIKIYYSWV